MHSEASYTFKDLTWIQQLPKSQTMPKHVMVEKDRSTNTIRPLFHQVALQLEVLLRHPGASTCPCKEGFLGAMHHLLPWHERVRACGAILDSKETRSV